MPISIPQEIQPFWDSFRASAAVDPTPRFCEAFHFGDTEALADELAALVLAGTKRATATLLASFEDEKRRPPAVGSLSVVTDWRGTPLCVIETTGLAVVPFDEVTEAFAAREGEGDKSLEDWQKAHTAYFGRECRRIGVEPGARMLLVCEEFAVVFRAII
ncbi:ASCH domain-containing protein [Variovorax sp. J22P271]|uniref:ASCH domain-containing protein n=1 Tax=Variovorax davisae TaxID=3053515 RepID=UPI002578ACE4|nr:ASCH domain-containing protein [Variovorax sp. J22P271]MDM0034695.1 ASCH domain-containing protein [Variovorax sp. J22P271]